MYAHPRNVGDSRRRDSARFQIKARNLTGALYRSSLIVLPGRAFDSGEPRAGGLGLAIAQAIAIAHGAPLSVRAPWESVSTFT